MSAAPMEPGGTERAAAPCTLVIFGGSGDLARRKLLPALYNLSVDGVLPSEIAVIGTGRKELGDEGFRQAAREGTEKFSRQAPDTARWAAFESQLFYHAGSLDDPENYVQLRRRIEEVELEAGLPPNRVFYLSIPPSRFAVCVDQLRAAGLVSDADDAGRFTRIIVEKPVGHDLQSAEVVNETLARAFDERQIFRIDHYLGKETVQNILVMRFGNSILEPLWNQKYIDHVQITVAEAEGVGTRAGYYEEAGALRDMVQNHILQVLCMTAMEPPWSLDPEAVRDHKLAVLKSLRPIVGAAVETEVVRAQYGPGFAADGAALPGYRQEADVARDSTTETYVALRVYVDNWRWAGVPFYIRTGKNLPRRTSEVAVQFKHVPHTLFNRDPQHPLTPNVLTLRLQPEEGFAFGISAKVPGPQVNVRPVQMDFSYGDAFADPSPEAYERLLLDVMAGDSTLFMRRDAVEAAWRFIDPILTAWSTDGARWLPEYDAGSWGPIEADRLIESTRDRSWRNS